MRKIAKEPQNGKPVVFLSTRANSDDAIPIQLFRGAAVVFARIGLAKDRARRGEIVLKGGGQ